MLEPTLISEHFPFLQQAILAGLGVGLVPDYVVQQEVASGDIVTTLNEYRLSIFGTQMFLLTMPNRYQTRAARTFIDFILERAQAAR
jgi:DNA-binding transcriptional LysR family regulator